MTVKELIEELQKYQEDKQIMLTCTYDFGYGTAGGTQIQILEDRDTVELYNDEC